MKALQILFALLLLCLSHIAQAQEKGLKNDLFQISPSRDTQTTSGSNAQKGSASSSWQPTLKAILFAGQQSLINLNGSILQLGDEINGYKVKRISETSVLLKSRNDTITLSLDQGLISPSKPNTETTEATVENGNQADENTSSKQRERGTASD